MHGVILDGVLRGHCDIHTEGRARYAFGRYSVMFMQVAGSWFPWALTMDLGASRMTEKDKLLVTARNATILSTECSL